MVARLLALMTVLVVAAPAGAAPSAEAWPRWTAHDPTSTATVDNRPWDAFLRAYLVAGADGVRRVAYGGVTAEDRAALDAYVDGLAAVPVSDLNRPEQRAYWINLYNALTVKVVLDHYPVDSIRDIDISPGLFADGPWGRKLVSVEGTAISLDDIEHRILRPLWRDPRLHYVLNCASVGCPDLPSRAVTADGTETLLDAAARRYINHSRGARVDGGRLVVSSIYDWFMEDFGGDDSAVIAHLRRYADPPLLARLDGIESIADDAYDWALNDAK